MINGICLEFIKHHRLDDPRDLALQASRYPDVDMQEAVVQIAAWQMARKKLPLWAETDGIIFPRHLSMEQCSSQMTAEYKARVIRTESLDPQMENGKLYMVNGKCCDLTAGFCVDATMIGRQFDHVTVVERQTELCEIAKNNLPLLGIKDFEVINDDSVEVLKRLPHQDLIFIDPARRDANGGKTVAISDCTPDVTQIGDLLLEKADRVMIKLSPMLDISNVMRELKGVAEIHIVSVDGECKEVLVVAGAQPNDPQKGNGKWYMANGKCCAIHCVNIVKGAAQDFCFTADEEQRTECHYTSALGRYLYEPNASIMKASAFKSVAARYGVQKLHPSSHLYTSDIFVEGFPGRSFEIVGTSSFNKKELARLLKECDNESSKGSKGNRANLTVRNFPSSVADLRGRLKLSEGGSNYIFATTLADESHVLILCRKNL